MRTPPPSSVNARNTMRANRAESGTERRLRSAVWALGGRGYRVRSRLLGRPDMVFPKERLAVFVHGCFWHGCEACSLPRPKAHADFWSKKLADNVARDARVRRELEQSGWDVLEVWEHAVRRDARDAAAEVLARRACIRRSA